jgi:hypothetical protein
MLVKKSAAPRSHFLSAADWALIGVFIVVAAAVLGFQG